MTIFAQGNTAAAACSAGNFCTGNSTLGDTTTFLQASEGGTPSVVNQTAGAAASANQADTVFWEIIDGDNNLEDLDGATGNWDFFLNVVITNMNLTWTGVAACRVNSSCVNQETIVGNQSFSVSLGTSGTKNSGVINQGSTITMGATDLIVAAYALDNADTMMSATFQFDPDLTITNQWAGPAPSGRVMSSLAGAGGLAGKGGIAGAGGGLAGAPEMRLAA